MANYGEVLAALKDFRSELAKHTFDELQASRSRSRARFKRLRGAWAAFRTPLANIHATGVGIRLRRDRITREHVLKVYVFEKLRGLRVPEVLREFQGIGVDIEALPIQETNPPLSFTPNPANQQARTRMRPIVGGVSIAPLGADYVGTLGCFVRRAGSAQVLALSNNHVLANVDSLAPGTQIVQPGPESGPTQPGDVFATLVDSVPVKFPDGSSHTRINYVDAAIAAVADASLIEPSAIFELQRYAPGVRAALPNMKVAKAGRTSGVTTGTVTATHVDGVHINYGTPFAPRLAVFNDTIEIQGANGQPFSLPGDSGSVVIDNDTGKPVALLFAGDGLNTTACDFSRVCQRFQADPV
jgi:hypothetical protein